MSGLQSAVTAYRPVRPSPLLTLQELGAFVALPLQPRPLAAPRAAAPASDHAVLVIPPLLNDDRQTRHLRAAMARAGYAAFGWDLGIDLGPTPKLLDGVEARLFALHRQYGPVSLVGLSMGGLFCRWLARRRPDRVRQVVTVCSPFRAPLDSFFLPLRPAMKVWPVPDLEAMAEDIAEPLPVPATALYSRRDGVVAWESCYDPDCPADSIAIDTPHVAIANDPAVLEIVVRRLGRGLSCAIDDRGDAGGDGQ